MRGLCANIRLATKVLPVLLILAAVIPPAATAQTAREYHAQAVRAAKNFDYRGAEKLISKALEESPDNFDYLLFRGDIYLGLERYDRARQDFEAAMAMDSMEVEPWIGRGRYFLYVGHSDSALYNAYMASILAETAYSEAKANTALGEIMATIEQDEPALRHLEKGLALDTSNTRALKLLSTLEIKRNNYEKARTLLERARMYDQWDLETLINLAYTSNKLEDYDRAVEYCNLALTLDNNHPLALSNRAFAYLHRGQAETALKNINKSIRNDRRNPTAYKYKGDILIALEKTSKACRSYQRADRYGASVIHGDAVKNLLEEHCK